MKRRLIASLAIAMMLVATMAMPAMALEQPLGAGVQVNEVINFTITDPGNPGLRFGAVNADTADNPEVEQGIAGAVTLVIGADTNVSCNLTVRGTHFNQQGGPGQITIDNAHWDTDNLTPGYITMQTYDVLIMGSIPIGGSSLDIWHWLTIPAATGGGDYQSMFYYNCINELP